MTKICMLLNNFEAPYGGPELQAQKIANKLMERGHDVVFIAKGSGSAPNAEIIDGIPVYRLNVPGLASVEAYYALWKHKQKFDIIHVHGVGRLAAVAMMMGKLLNKKVYIKVTTAGHILKKLPGGFKGFLKGLSPFRQRKVDTLKEANGMIAISKEILDELNENGFDPSKIAFIPNGVDTTLFRPADERERGFLRHKLGLPVDKKVILFTGKLTKRKGLDTLIQAWQQAGIQDKAVLILAGSGKGQADSLENWLDLYIAANNLSTSVVKAGDISNVNEYLAAADIFAFPSRREGLPNSLLEAMAAGLICLASPIGGNIDLIDDGSTGILVSAEDIAAWANALQQAVNALPSHLGTAAVQLIGEKYSMDNTVNSLEKLYKTL